jgi:hypothetical protein
MNPNRRRFLLVLAGLACVPLARAGDWTSITSSEAAQALRDSLSQGARNAVGKLGRENGFFGNAKVKIGLPRNFAKAEGFLRRLGMGRQVDDLVLAMNRAAEAAVPEARDIILDSVQKMSVVDAKAVLSGGDGAATAWFRKNTEAQLGDKLAPIITAVAEKSDLVRSYNNLESRLVRLTGGSSEITTVEDYVKRKALDGLYSMMADEEHAIRTQPLQQASHLVGKVFESLHFEQLSPRP